MTTTARRMWCDDFDLDLPKIVPHAWDLIQAVPAARLITTGGETHGTLNHPEVWNDPRGFVAYFGLGDDPRRPWPSHFVATSPLVSCSFQEMIRDAWVHDYVAFVEGEHMWGSRNVRSFFDALMFHHRRWTVLSEARLRFVEQAVIDHARAACAAFLQLLACHPWTPITIAEGTEGEGTG